VYALRLNYKYKKCFTYENQAKSTVPIGTLLYPDNGFYARQRKSKEANLSESRVFI
jgi:hypothetical protein